MFFVFTSSYILSRLLALIYCSLFDFLQCYIFPYFICNLFVNISAFSFAECQPQCSKEHHSIDANSNEHQESTGYCASTNHHASTDNDDKSIAHSEHIEHVQRAIFPIGSQSKMRRTGHSEVGTAATSTRTICRSYRSMYRVFRALRYVSGHAWEFLTYIFYYSNENRLILQFRNNDSTFLGVRMNCPNDLRFNQLGGYCDWPNSVDECRQ